MHSVLITGGTGFLGRGLVRRLLDDGARRVRIYSRNEFAQSRMRDDYADERWASSSAMCAMPIGSSARCRGAIS
jgi:FlaA1/EpsC-like NDP-sugar epimerase